MKRRDPESVRGKRARRQLTKAARRVSAIYKVCGYRWRGVKPREGGRRRREVKRSDVWRLRVLCVECDAKVDVPAKHPVCMSCRLVRYHAEGWDRYARRRP